MHQGRAHMELDTPDPDRLPASTLDPITQKGIKKQKQVKYKNSKLKSRRSAEQLKGVRKSLICGDDDDSDMEIETLGSPDTVINPDEVEPRPSRILDEEGMSMPIQSEATEVGRVRKKSSGQQIQEDLQQKMAL